MLLLAQYVMSKMPASCYPALTSSRYPPTCLASSMMARISRPRFRYLFSFVAFHFRATVSVTSCSGVKRSGADQLGFLEML